MLENLSETGYLVPTDNFPEHLKKEVGAATSGVAHWSRSGATNRLVTNCKDRRLFQQLVEEKADRWKRINIPKRDPSLDEREKQGFGWIKPGEKEQAVRMPYPISCDEYDSAQAGK